VSRLPSQPGVGRQVSGARCRGCPARCRAAPSQVSGRRQPGVEQSSKKCYYSNTFTQPPARCRAVPSQVSGSRNGFDRIRSNPCCPQPGVGQSSQPGVGRLKVLQFVTFCVGQSPARCRAPPARCRAPPARCRAVPSQVSGSPKPGVGRQVSGWRQRRCRAVPSECPKTCQNLPKLARCRAPGVEQSPARCRAVPGRPGVGQAPGVEQSPGDKTLGADLPQGFSVQLSPQRRRQVSGSPQPGVGQAPAVGAYRLPTACLPRPPALFP
jgi:hypothetical protein